MLTLALTLRSTHPYHLGALAPALGGTRLTIAFGGTASSAGPHLVPVTDIKTALAFVR